MNETPSAVTLTRIVTEPVTLVLPAIEPVFETPQDELIKQALDRWRQFELPLQEGRTDEFDESVVGLAGLYARITLLAMRDGKQELVTPAPQAERLWWKGERMLTEMHGQSVVSGSHYAHRVFVTGNYARKTLLAARLLAGNTEIPPVSR